MSLISSICWITLIYFLNPQLCLACVEADLENEFVFASPRAARLFNVVTFPTNSRAHAKAEELPIFSPRLVGRVFVEMASCGSPSYNQMVGSYEFESVSLPGSPSPKKAKLLCYTVGRHRFMFWLWYLSVIWNLKPFKMAFALF